MRATSGRYYRPEFGVPPRELRIYQAAEADWQHGFCKQPFIAGWRFAGGPDVEPIAPDDLPDYSIKPSGMYWPIGQIDFIIDTQQKRALYTYVLGPRYGRGFKVTFEDVSTLAFVSEKGRLIWMS